MLNPNFRIITFLIRSALHLKLSDLGGNKGNFDNGGMVKSHLCSLPGAS